MKKPTEEPLLINKRIWEFIEYIKTRSVVSIVHLEEFEKLLNNLSNSFDDLRRSRDNWKKKHEELADTVAKYIAGKK